MPERGEPLAQAGPGGGLQRAQRGELRASVGVGHQRGDAVLPARDGAAGAGSAPEVAPVGVGRVIALPAAAATGSRGSPGSESRSRSVGGGAVGAVRRPWQWASAAKVPQTRWFANGPEVEDPSYNPAAMPFSRRVLALLATAALLISPAAALAQSAGDDQYQDPLGQVKPKKKQTTSAPKKQASGPRTTPPTSSTPQTSTSPSTTSGTSATTTTPAASSGTTPSSGKGASSKSKDLPRTGDGRRPRRGARRAPAADRHRPAPQAARCRCAPLTRPRPTRQRPWGPSSRARCDAGDVVLVQGEMGAGKTTFVRGGAAGARGDRRG